MAVNTQLDKETAEILRVIGQPTAALTNRDYASYQEAYLHAPHIRQVGGWSHGDGNWTPGGVFVQEGWDQVWPSTRQFFEEWPYAVYPHGTYCTNWNLRVGRDMAWATFDQYPLDASGQPSPDVIGFLRETRMLEKHSGKWKLVLVNFLHELPRLAEQPVVRVDEHAAIIEIAGMPPSGLTTARCSAYGTEGFVQLTRIPTLGFGPRSEKLLAPTHGRSAHSVFRLSCERRGAPPMAFAG